ncbi:uncharacterized protein Eint_081720 [Encephalitozoon intestinalis ATCC 50506]|uniref:PH domain-containing protein n=1 Tax=Encephalitozoon intestinalis (strain ATCC 50506) TaxID=876142 RepID=E0S8R6_ENCIT|nr:uncharacterized protein Eint_081720 [Encephalitozoon intestinalis ATCC 50506]ADM12104.1 hypothetical protein Eint_081720 [Encephalitozoon intestinalis ATCC 50506]UTX45896.1 hypothetical protein GPK93_08g14750 [Encephalitozoon intestinalis]
MKDKGSYNQGLESQSTEMLLSILEHYDTNFIEERIIDEYAGMDSSKKMAQSPWGSEDPGKCNPFQEKEEESEYLESQMICNFLNSYGMDVPEDSYGREEGKSVAQELGKENEGLDGPSQGILQGSTVDLSELRNLTDPISLEKALEFERLSIHKEELVRNAESQKKIIEAFRSIPGLAIKENLLNDIKINKVYVESRIHIRKENGKDIREKRNIIKGEREREGGKETIVFNDYVSSGWESGSESSSDIAAKEKAFKVIKEAERRATGKDLLCNADMQLRKFVVDQEERYLRIEKVMKLNDLKYKNLMGKIYKKGKNGKYQYNWFTLKKNFFTCYNGKGTKTTSEDFPYEKEWDFKNPEDEDFFFKRKYTIDLLNAGVYLVKHPVCIGCVKWGCGTDEDLIDISEDTKIMRITPAKSHFLISLKKNLVKTEIKMTTLDFALKANGETYFYRMKDLDGFLGWLVAFAFRQGKIKCNIG